MSTKYDIETLRHDALLQDRFGVSVHVPPRELLALLDDLASLLELNARYRHTLERIVAWDYPCRDDGCEAGEVAAKAFEEKLPWQDFSRKS